MGGFRLVWMLEWVGQEDRPGRARQTQVIGSRWLQCLERGVETEGPSVLSSGQALGGRVQPRGLPGWGFEWGKHSSERP